MNPDEQNNTITEESGSDVSVSISADVESIAEGNDGDTATVTYTITTSEPLDRDARVIVESAGGDNPLVSEPLDILAGEQSVTFTNQVSGDNIPEEDETLTGTIAFAAFNAEDGSTGTEIAIAQPTATVTVTDDDSTDGGETPAVSISADVNVIPEGDEGDTTTITYTVDLGQILEQNARLAVDVFNGDGSQSLNRIEIPAGEQTFSFTDEVVGDNLAENSEIFSASIANTNIINAGNGEGIDSIVRDPNQNVASVVVSDDDGGNDIVYRFFNPSAGVHFYTDDENERQFVQSSLDNYDFEGASYRTVDSLTGGAEEVYRFFNSRTGVHLYTISENERDFIRDNLEEFSFEGSVFSAYETQVEGSIPIYRFFEPSIGVHFYTPNQGERDFIEANLPNYNSEGIAYYALPLNE